MTERQSRIQRSRLPLAKDVVREVAENHGVCIRPIPLKRINLDTGASEIVNVPCGHTLASVCPPCAERKKRLRAQQCAEGWHLDTEPDLTPDDPDERQRALISERAELTRARDELVAKGVDVGEIEAAIIDVDDQLTRSGVRGAVEPARRKRRVRSTRRRQDVPNLPRRQVEARTIGRTYTGSGGKTFRPSIFLTLTCDSYGRVRSDGTPVDPDSYDYVRAARDALHFSKLVDRFIQNLRRFLGFDVQYFATVEPQRRLAPHLHLAMRGTASRAELRQVAAATYHQVWWPACDTVAYSGDHLPTWDTGTGNYCDPDAEPLHVVRFGRQIDAQGVIAGTPDAGRCIGYLTKYLVKDIADCHDTTTAAQAAHLDRLCDALRYEPCAPTCANWLRYGIQPANPRPGMRPGHCKSKAHQRRHLGYAGRRVLTSRKWTGKTLADHKADRHAYVTALLAAAGLPTPDQSDHDTGRYAWQPIHPTDPEVPPVETRIMHGIAERIRQRQTLDQARRHASQPDDQLAATGLAA